MISPMLVKHHAQVRATVLAVIFAAASAVSWSQVLPNPSQGPVLGAGQNATRDAATAGARFLESCNEAIDRGMPAAGCQGPLYRNELERLKQEALTSRNPQLLSMVGEAYENNRSGVGDVGQAYRWYLLAAVRGDARAMQRLAELNRAGQGAPRDTVKAMGYARLVQRMAQSSDALAGRADVVVRELGAQMAAEELALADTFADELAARIQRQSGTGAADLPASKPALAPLIPGVTPADLPTSNARPDPAMPGSQLPGMPTMSKP